METYIRISTLNDAVFCPKSIYFHELYQKYDTDLYHDTPQEEGTLNHAPIDTKTYSTSKDVIQALPIYSDIYGLCGKIDLYHIQKKSLMERKTKIVTLYQGYIYQLRAQYLCMIEMGYEVDIIKCYSMEDNIVHIIAKPTPTELEEFTRFLEEYRNFDPTKKGFTQNSKKCASCIYRELCDTYLMQPIPKKTFRHF